MSESGECGESTESRESGEFSRSWKEERQQREALWSSSSWALGFLEHQAGVVDAVLVCPSQKTPHFQVSCRDPMSSFSVSVD